MVPHARPVAESLADEGIAVDLLTVSPGEATKSAAAAATLWDELLAAGTGRRSVVLAVGGGVVGDLAGFVAATFARGLAFVQIPTTLLAQVDSSVGGKVGINLPGAKNMVGAFWQPRRVLIDTDVLATCPIGSTARVWPKSSSTASFWTPISSAFLEIYAVEINDRDEESCSRWSRAVASLKADVVEADERETSGRRAVLNYGHTFGHAFEAVAGYGQLCCTAKRSRSGCCAPRRLAETLGRIDSETTRRQLDSGRTGPARSPPRTRP